MKLVGRIMLSAGLVLALSGFIQIEKMLAPKADLWAFWQVSDEGNNLRIDHAAWSGFLGRYLVTDADRTVSVRYADVAPDDRRKLENYVSGLSGLAIRRYNKAEQLAYWINLYNARTLLLILEHYPVDSIMDIKLSGGFLTSGPWAEKLMQIEGQDVSLNDIEHRILRPIWQDARLHYALNCASRGCPDLQGAAFTPQNTEALMERAARTFINQAKGVREEEGQVILSKIYAWFEDDFGADESALFKHLSTYAHPDLKSTLATDPIIMSYRYDWNLNDAPGD